ncbi:MAG: AAA family ATPase [Candidatus Veblenbacteria bacterium]|nr:AAA family ATPase [Candidatus Veblenbacteria bacterium]
MTRSKPLRRSRGITSPVVVVFVGEKLSGKEQAAQYLVKKYGFHGYHFSRILTDILQRLHLPVSRMNQMHLVGALRERFGGGVLAEVIKQDILKHGYKRVVLDGLRHPAEYDALKVLPGFLLVYLTAPLNVRYQRARQRREKAGEHRLSLQDFKREEKLVTEVFISKLGHKAKVKVVNEGSLSELYHRLEEELVKPYLL